MNSLEDARQEFLSLRNQSNSAQLATLDDSGHPEASYAPLVWHEGVCYLYLSQLASHTRNLQRNPALGLLLVEAEAGVRNPFARRRISLQGQVLAIDRDSDLFRQVLAVFRQRFGEVMATIEPLPDFHLYRVELRSGRFIRGFGQAFDLVGDDCDELRHIDPRR